MKKISFPVTTWFGPTPIQISQVMRGRLMGKMALEIVNPEAADFVEAIGITPERRAELINGMNEEMQRFAGQAVRTCEVLNAMVMLCNNLEEVVYVTLLHSKHMYEMGNPY
jgi:hypothetical protein